MNNRRQGDIDLLPAIRRGRIETLNIYDVSEAELQALERGSSESLFLNFAIFLLSSAISLLVALLTTNIESNRTFIVFVVCTVIAFTGGSFLLALWGWHRRSRSQLFEQIRRRIPPEGIRSETALTIDQDPSTPEPSS